MCPPPPDLLESCGLPSAWAGLNAWTILDTTLDGGTKIESALGPAFLTTWHRWRADPQRPRLLHYVAIVATGSPLPEALRSLCVDLCAGFNRILLDGGQVSLTLCVGDLQTMLSEHTFQADTLFLGSQRWDKWLLKLLSRRCKRGATFWAMPQDADLHTLLPDAGFRCHAQKVQSPVQPLQAPAFAQAISGCFDPPWSLANSRQLHATGQTTGPTNHPADPARCTVVGAGIAGATVAHALALRGWEVTVLDTHTSPAGGASALPAGLVVPHVSGDDNPRSRISRSGIRLMHQHAKNLLIQGQDWEPTGVQEHRGLDPQKSSAAPATVHWHAQGAWFKPAALVQALLKHPRIRFVAQAQVSTLALTNGTWCLRNPQGHVLADTDVVVFAAALDSVALLQALPPSTPPEPQVKTNVAALHAVHGTLSQGLYGPHTSAAVLKTFPPFPVNGNGSFLPRIPTEDGFQWLAGATFETDATALDPVSAQHRSNLERLSRLLPATAAALACALGSNAKGDFTLSHWSGTRCASHDRLPLVGPLQAAAPYSLWMSAGMGSRGLSFSAVCAELLVAQLCAEPWPLEQRLARSLDVRRTRRSQRPSPVRQAD